MNKVPVCVLNDTRVDRHHGCQRVMTAIEALLTSNGCELLATCAAGRDWTSDSRFRRALERSRLVIVNGEGTIHHDRPAGRRLLEIADWARKRSVPAALINAGWENNGLEFARLLGNFALVSARDSMSATEIRSFGITARVVPDLSLFDASLPPVTDRRQELLFTDCVDRTTALVLARLCRQCSGRPLSISYAEPGVLGYVQFLREGVSKSDLRSPATFASLIAMRHRLYRHSFPSTTHFMQELRRASLLVTGRFHACALALLAEVPFVSVPSNTRKIQALIADAGLEPWRCDVSLTAEGILCARDQGWSIHEMAAVRSYLASARTAATSLFRDLKALA